jgi:uncharacterized protein YfdQ (DUF2303 family)
MNYSDETNEVEAAVQAGVESAKAADRIHVIDADLDGVQPPIPVAIIPSGMKLHALTDVLDAQEARGTRPARRKGTATHREIDSFITHVNRFKDDDSAIWANPETVRISAVLNYHRSGVGDARWGDHRSLYTCPLSDQWKLWTGRHEKLFGQEEFGSFIEDNFADLANPIDDDAKTFPTPTGVLEMARNLVIRQKGEFSRSINPTTGESSLVAKNENETSSTKIPKAFLLKLPVFEGGELYRVEARMRFSMPDGRPKFSFALYQANLILQHAFAEVRARVATGTSLPVFVGEPEATK